VLKPLQTSEEVDLVFDEPPRTCPPLRTDEAKVSQILRNFVSNALKFTEVGEVRVAASYDAGSGRVTFDVSDTGIGIAPEHQAGIFEEFVQVENRLQHRTKGTGLGLPLSRKLAELLGGEVAVASAPGRGSTFSLSIPAVYGQNPGSGSPGPEDRPGAPRGTILIVDDEEASRYVLRQLIGEPRYVIEEAADGREGLRKARTVRPDAIFLDLHLPEVDGYTILDELAAHPETRDVPVAVSTSALIGPDQRRRLAHARVILPKNALSREAVASFLRQSLPDSRES
jgi:CheY-like chemotaxis protein